MKLEQKDIIDFIENVNFQTKEISKEIVIAEILSFIKEIDFMKIDKIKSYYNDVPENYRDVEINIESINNEYPKIVFDVLRDNTVSIRVGIGEGEYIDSEIHDNWKRIYILRDVLNDLFYNQLTEKVYYCDGKIIGNDCSIPYKKEGEKKTYRFSKRLGICMFWNKKIVKTYTYKSWLVVR